VSDSGSNVLDHILDSIDPASVAQATAAAQKLMRSGIGNENDGLAALATRLCAARHSPQPNLTKKSVIVIAADHGVASPGVDLGENNPTLAGIQMMERGEAALNTAARSAEANMVLVDVGIRGGDRIDVGKGVLSFRIGDSTKNFSKEPAMTMEQANAAIQTGVALAFSLADAGLDLLALGHLAAGSQPASVAMVAALTGADPKQLSEVDADVVEQALRVHSLGEAHSASHSPIEILSLVGGFDIGVLAGIILAASSIYVPILLDGHGTSAAALLAARLKPEVQGYLFASHGGGIAAHAHALDALRLDPLFAVGLAHGEGTAGLLAMPMLDAAARVLAEA
jgi:nicotinate-nucleotide--dimethylbenzimidazole phosphoribosyltransferase